MLIKLCFKNANLNNAYNIMIIQFNMCGETSNRHVRISVKSHLVNVMISFFDLRHLVNGDNWSYVSINKIAHCLL